VVLGTVAVGNIVAIDDRVLQNTKNAESEISGPKMNVGTNPLVNMIVVT